MYVGTLTKRAWVYADTWNTAASENKIKALKSDLNYRTKIPAYFMSLGGYDREIPWQNFWSLFDVVRINIITKIAMFFKNPYSEI